MYYPKHFGPETEMQMLAMLHGQLSGAYSIIAQYEEEERKRENKSVSESLRRMMSDESAYNAARARKYGVRGERPPGEDPDPFAPAPDPFAPQPDPFDGKTTRKQDADHRPTGPGDDERGQCGDPGCECHQEAQRHRREDTVEDDGRC